MATLSLDEEVRLYTNNAEREKYNLLGTLYGIIVALDYLERAYVRDAITAAQYVFIINLLHIRLRRNAARDILLHVPVSSRNT